MPAFILALALLLSSPCLGDDKKPPQPTPVLKGQAAEDVVRLKREVDALEVLYHLEPNKNQLAGLLALAEKTAAKPPAATAVTVSGDYVKTLKELHGALVKEDEEKVAALYQKLLEIEEDHPSSIEEAFDLTDAAIKAAPAALKLFTASQVISFLTAMESEVPDPVERITIALNEGEELPVEEWNSLRNETAEEVAWLVHGFNSDKGKALTKAVNDFLDRHHRLKGEALKKELDSIEQAARKLTGEVSPVAVLQHYMERELAELLSNPCAVLAMKARLEQLKK
jgi:hypothetical protein